MTDSATAHEALISRIASIVYHKNVLAVYHANFKASVKALEFQVKLRDDPPIALSFSRLNCSRAIAWLRLLEADGLEMCPDSQQICDHREGCYGLYIDNNYIGTCELKTTASLWPPKSEHSLRSLCQTNCKISLLIDGNSWHQVYLHTCHQIFFGELHFLGNSTLKISIKEVQILRMEDIPISINIGSLGLSLEQVLQLRPGMEVSFQHSGSFASTLEVGGHPWALGRLRLGATSASFEIEQLHALPSIQEKPLCPDQ